MDKELIDYLAACDREARQRADRAVAQCFPLRLRESRHAKEFWHRTFTRYYGAMVTPPAPRCQCCNRSLT